MLRRLHDCRGNRYSLIKENVTLVSEQGIVFDMCMVLFSRFIEYSLFWMHLMVAISVATTSCLHIRPLGTLVSSSANLYLQDRLSFGVYESDFISHSLSVIGMVLSVYLTKRCGRRLTMALMLATAIVSQVLLLNIRLEMYNACRKISGPQGWRATLAQFSYIFAMLSSAVLLIVPRLILMEHVPTSLRFLVPLAFVVDNITLLLRAGLRFLETRTSKAYPNGGFIYALGYTLFVAPFALLLDDSDHLPINTWEIPAYRTTQSGYSTNIVPNDTPSEHFSVRMMMQACAAAEETEMRARYYERKTYET
ncbi:hypothetical protein OESDEN_05504 [Oesophagostomum dentatum]|uniref:Uncharacterized protein n=1 Tax=Oesophagostomum dentatum TaxID=61180 RepID=A0A0B1TFH6_OESDE|nr:hypothetical protein OESDEN_05504 [Oesophagostomum dentatum]